MVKIESLVKCLAGAAVMVSNYRTKAGTWERGTVLDVEIHLRNDGSPRNVYRVKLDRLSTMGNAVFLHVGDDKINPLKK